MDKTVICPGCGWTGAIGKASSPNSDCPACGYSNGAPPFRLLTLSEMFTDGDTYAGVRMDLLLKSLFEFLGYPDNRDEWWDYRVVHYDEIDGG